MLSVAYKRLLGLINKGHERSVRAKKNILAAFALKGSNILIGFVLVPMYLHYLGRGLYGNWLAIASVLTYFALFDIGLGNGMRNRFAEAKAKGEHELARIYVSTTYASMALIMLAIGLLFLACYPFLPWANIFQAPPEQADEITQVVLIVFVAFFFKFFLQLISKIFMADQRSSFNNLFNFLSNFLVLCGVFILTQTTEQSILGVSIVFSLAPIIVLTAASLFFFARDYKAYRPSLKYVQFDRFGELMGLGGRFFIIQVAAIILFQTDQLMVLHFLGRDSVAPYANAYKYFNMIAVFFGMITTPLWSAITEAYTNGDTPWIKRTINKAMKIWVAALFGVGFLLLISSYFYPVWLRTEDHGIPFSLSLMMAIYVLMFTFNSIFVVFINGVGKLRLQIYTAIFGICANIPLSYLFSVKLGYGMPGIIGATCISIGLSLILRPLQYNKLINGTATGVWNK